MAQKFFSIETYSDKTGEIVGITTSIQLQDRITDFKSIEDYCIEVANLHHCKGAVRDEFGRKALDFNWSPSCEDQICFSWSDEQLLTEFIANHTPEPQKDEETLRYNLYKKAYPNTILLFPRGDFFETYHDDAIEAAKVLGITLTKRNSTGTYLAGFPRHTLDQYLPRLVRKGHRVIICDESTEKEAERILRISIEEAIKLG